MNDSANGARDARICLNPGAHGQAAHAVRDHNHVGRDRLVLVQHFAEERVDLPTADGVRLAPIVAAGKNREMRVVVVRIELAFEIHQK